MSDPNLSSYRIEALKGPDNYPVWRVQMRDILTDLGLWGHTDGTNVRPADATQREAWDKNDRKALTAIRLRISGSMITYVLSATQSKAAWDSLESVFNIQGPISIIVVRRKLLRYVIEDEANLEEEIRTLRGWKEQLELLSDPLDDKQFALTILTALPESWDSFIGSVDLSQPSAAIIGRILGEESRRKSRSGAETSLVATVSKSASRNNPNSRPKRKSQGNSRATKSTFRAGVFCHHCKKEGHIRPECRTLKKELDSSGSNANRWQSSGLGSGTNRSHLAETDSLEEYAFHIQDGPINSFAAVASDLWLGDSGTQSHIVRNKLDFISYKSTPGQTIQGAGKCDALGRGDVKIIFTVKGKRIPITLRDAIHAPDMPYNLISLGRLTSAGFSYYGTGNHVYIKDNSAIVGVGHKLGNLYSMEVEHINRAYAVRTARTWYEWHRILGHLNKSQLRDLKSLKLVDGMDIDPYSTLDFDCKTCILAKQSRIPFPQESATQYSSIGDLVHTDIWGPARTQSIHGNSYIITFTDAFSRHTAVYFMKSRSSALDRFRKYRAFVKLQTDRDIKILRSDNAKEYTEGDFKIFVEGEGILLQTTAPYSPAQNGVAERLNRTLIEHARAMLIQHSLPKFLWEDAVIYANYLKNRSPTRALKGITPYEAFTGKRPDIQNLQEFGVDCWVLTPDSKRSKLDAKSDKYTYLGTSDAGVGWKYLHTPTRQVLVSRNVVFRSAPDFYSIVPEVPSRVEGETAPAVSSASSAPLASQPKPKATRQKLPPVVTERAVTRNRPRLDYKQLHNTGKVVAAQPPIQSSAPTDSDATPSVPDPATQILESTNLVFATTSATSAFDQPQSLAEVRSRSDWPMWKEAMDAEIGQLHDLTTYELTDLPQDRKPVGCRWVFLIKRDADGNITKYKARYLLDHPRAWVLLECVTQPGTHSTSSCLLILHRYQCVESYAHTVLSGTGICIFFRRVHFLIVLNHYPALPERSCPQNILNIRAGSSSDSKFPVIGHM